MMSRLPVQLTKHEVLEMLSQVHRDLETFRWATQRGSMNRRTRQWAGSKNRPVLRWSDGRVITTKELVVELGFQCKDKRGDVKTVDVFLAYSFEVMPAIRCGRVALVRYSD